MNSMRFFTAMGLVAVTFTIGYAQDFEKIAPKVPESKDQTITIAPPPVETNKDEKELIPNLQGLVFLKSTLDVKKDGRSGVEGVQTFGFPVAQLKEFERVGGKYIGKPVSLKSLNELTRDIIVLYRETNRPLVNVIVPEQDITGGVVQVVIMSGKAGTISIEGNKWFSTDRIRHSIRLHPGQEIEAKSLIQDMNWVNANPFRDMTLVLSPGQLQGDTDLTFRVKDRFPVRFYAGYEDTGNDLTGDERFVTGFNWGNAWGAEHMASYQFTSDFDFEKFVAHSGSYVAPLPWRHQLTVFGSHTETVADLGAAPFTLSGESWQASFRYSIPLASLGDYVSAMPLVQDILPDLLHSTLPGLPILRDYVHEVVFGMDYKQSNNNLEFGGAQVFNQDTDIVQYVTGYNSGLRDPLGKTSFDVNWFFSPGDLTDDNTDTAFALSRANADASYIYEKASLERVTRLPWDFSLIGKAAQQYAFTGNLLGSEQMGLGGSTSVRGYEEREANGDIGYFFSAELRTPSFHPNIFFDVPRSKDLLRDDLQFLAFFDYGSAEIKDELPGQRSVTTLESIGGGLRYAVSNYLSVRADYGFQLRDTGASRDNSRLHLGVLLSY